MIEQINYIRLDQIRLDKLDKQIEYINFFAYNMLFWGGLQN